jgi:hypothetical protein
MLGTMNPAASKARLCRINLQPVAARVCLREYSFYFLDFTLLPERKPELFQIGEVCPNYINSVAGFAPELSFTMRLRSLHHAPRSGVYAASYSERGRNSLMKTGDSSIRSIASPSILTSHPREAPYACTGVIQHSPNMPNEKYRVWQRTKPGDLILA